MRSRCALLLGNWIRWTFLFGMLSACGVALGAPASPKAGPASSAEEMQTPPEEPVDPGSPRASVAEYLQLCREERYDEAARYLDVHAGAAKSKPGDLAKRLKAVIDRRSWIDIERLSPLASGNTNDGLPASYEDIGQIPLAAGQSKPIRLFNRGLVGGSPAWVVSRQTVDNIDRWYESLPQAWLLDRAPAWLLRTGPRELLIWQWIALPILFVTAWGLGAVLGNLTRWMAGRGKSQAWVRFNVQLQRRLRGPLTLIWALALVYAALPFLWLFKPADEFVRSFLRGGFYFTLFWSVSRLIDSWGKAIAESPWAHERSSAKALVPIGVRLAKILLLIVAVVVLISAMGYPAGSIVAGLGIGGLAVALAAQKTIENLFGAFTLGADEPFRVGDFVKIEDFVGTIESIGLRSTRIRTLDRTIITIPNGRLSEMRIENYSTRDRLRFACNLGLTYDTSEEQLRAVLAKCERALREHPRIWSEGITVRLQSLGDSALVIEIMAWFQTTDWAEFQRIREETLLEFMRIVAGAGASFAFPTRTVQLMADPPRPEPRPNTAIRA